MTTGDELVDAAETPGPGQIRDANLHTMRAQLQEIGAIPVPFPRVPDRPEAVREALERALATCDVVVTNGGISVGDYDFLKEVLGALGAKLLLEGGAAPRLPARRLDRRGKDARQPPRQPGLGDGLPRGVRPPGAPEDDGAPVFSARSARRFSTRGTERGPLRRCSTSSGSSPKNGKGACTPG